MRQSDLLVHRGVLKLLIRVVLLLSLAMASKGMSAEIATSLPGKAAATDPIAVSDILVRADEDQLRVERARQLLEALDPVEHLNRTLEDIERPVDAKLHGTLDGALRTLPVMRLESLSRHWAFEARRFARWEEQARHILAPYADSALQLAQRRAVWSATRAAGVGLSYPPASKRYSSRSMRPRPRSALR